jgi:hypothetical protein
MLLAEIQPIFARDSKEEENAHNKSTIDRWLLIIEPFTRDLESIHSELHGLDLAALLRLVPWSSATR